MAMQKEILLQFVLGSPQFDPRLTGLFYLQKGIHFVLERSLVHLLQFKYALTSVHILL